MERRTTVLGLLAVTLGDERAVGTRADAPRRRHAGHASEHPEPTPVTDEARAVAPALEASTQELPPRRRRRIRAAGMTRDVTFEPVDASMDGRIDDAHRAKYGRARIWRR